MNVVELLRRPLDATDSGCEVHTLPAGQRVRVHQSADPRWLVVLDGRVYRADAFAVIGAIR